MIEFLNADSEMQKLLKRIYKAAMKHFKQKDIFVVEVKTVDDLEIRRLNRELRGVDSVTDVLSFPSLEISSLPVKKTAYADDVDPESGRIVLGEIVMCMEKIVSQAAEYGHSVVRESGYLFLHGLLHLLGYDHIEEVDRAKMRAEEEAILNTLKIVRE
jgi:metalloprotein, YbeY/UPF0054 family